MALPVQTKSQHPAWSQISNCQAVAAEYRDGIEHYVQAMTALLGHSLKEQLEKSAGVHVSRRTQGVSSSASLKVQVNNGHV